VGNVIEGTFTIKQVMLFTRQYFRNRFAYEKRDVLRKVFIKKRVDLKTTREGEPTVKFQITTYSYPQYKPYVLQKGEKSKKQRKIRHEYDTILELDRLSINTKNWKARLGSQAKWVTSVNPKLIGKLSERDKARMERKIETDLKRKGKATKTNIKKELSKQIKDFRNKRRYLNIGDYNAQVKGLNGDFLFRCEYVYRMYGHLYGIDNAKRPPVKTNPKSIIFFPKHLIRLMEYLLLRGKLKND